VNWRCRPPTAPTVDADRTSLNEEFVQLAQEATRTLGGTQFNGQNILATTNAATFQIGANTTATMDQITVTAFDWTAPPTSPTCSARRSTGTDADDCRSPAPTAASALTASTLAIDAAIDSVNSQRATFGAVQNRFENVVATLMVGGEPDRRAQPHHGRRLRRRNGQPVARQILQQAGNAMVAQANQLPQQVLALLR
jgi:flagellin